MGSKGKAGCGCLLGILVTIMILAGVLFHPVSLKFMAKQFRYEDKIVPADAIFVPRFPEDRNGELYVQAFREYFEGNGKTVYVEDDKVLGVNIGDLLSRMAKERGIKEGAIKPVHPGNDRERSTTVLNEKFRAMGLKKVIVIVPGYVSRRYHYMYDSSRQESAVLYMIKPVQVSYFRTDAWWRDDLSRSLMAREFYASLVYYYSLLRKDTAK